MVTSFPRLKRWLVAGLAVVAVVVSFWVMDVSLQAADYSLPTRKLDFAKLKPASAVEVRDSNGRLIDYWYDGDRLHFYRPLSDISKEVPDFLVLLEDAKFFHHSGFDFEEIKHSIEENFEKGKVKRGASTITQQLAKNLFLDKERSLQRKLFEVPWAMRLEKDFSKKQILELYLNVIEWGPGVYGVEAASRHFFDKTAAQLSKGNAMYLALIVPNPKRFDLFATPKMGDFLQKKKKWLVERLVNEKKIAPEEKELYMAESFGLVPPDAPGRRFPARHEAKYFGNRDKRPASLVKIEKALRPKSKGNSIQLTHEQEVAYGFAPRPVVESAVAAPSASPAIELSPLPTPEDVEGSF